MTKEIKEILNPIPLLQNIKKIEKINIESRCKEKYKIITSDNIYFIKIEDTEYNEKEIKKIKWLYQSYKEEKIPVVDLIDVIVSNKKTIWIFPYFNDKNLLESNFTLEEFSHYGKKIAKDIKKLNNKKPDFELFKNLSLHQHFKERKEKIEMLINNIETKDKLLKIFSLQEWNKLLKHYENLLKKIEKDPTMINHNDIKLPNFLIDEKNNYYFIDIDPFDLTPVIYNIGYSLSCFLFSDHEKEKAFISGFIKEIDKTKELINQMNYFLISDFINKIEKNYKQYQENNKYIKSVLYNENNIIIKNIYNY